MKPVEALGKLSEALEVVEEARGTCVHSIVDVERPISCRAMGDFICGTQATSPSQTQSTRAWWGGTSSKATSPAPSTSENSKVDEEYDPGASPSPSNAPRFRCRSGRLNVARPR